MSLEERRLQPNGPDAKSAQRDEQRRKEKGARHFWRACRFLYPYRWMVAVSIVCALFVSVTNTAGLGTMLPIMRVLVKGDTIATWADREIVQRRLGAKFSDDSNDLILVKITPDSAAAAAKLNEQDTIIAGPHNSREDIGLLLAALADPARSTQTVHLQKGGDVQLSLPPLPWYLAAGHEIAARWPTHPVKAIAAVFGILAIMATVASFAAFFQEYLSDKAAVLAVNDIRRRLYDRVLHVPLSHFNLRGTSDVTSRLTGDAQGLAEGYKTVLGQSIQEPMKALMAFSFALAISWKLTLFIVLFTPLMLAIIRKFGKKMRRASKKALMNSANMLGQIEASLIGIRVVKGANAERFERRRYTRIMAKLITEQLRMSRIDSISEPTIGTLTFFVVGAVVMVASYLVLIQHSLDVTKFFVLMACLASIGDSLRRVSKVNNVLQRSNAAASRIFEVMDLPIEKKGWHGKTVAPEAAGSVNGRAGAAVPGSNGNIHVTENEQAASDHRPRIKLNALLREVRFENVTFAYPGTQAPAVIGVNLVVPKGKCIAVVGRNGSGKTTLLALLPRFYDPQQGRILIDDIDVRDLTLRSLRDQISLVTQDSVIFPGTIVENIAYGHPLASAAADSIPGRALHEEVERAAKQAFAHEFILEKPQGYGTLLGGLGAQLSGGQKQRICIARAIMRKSPILVLDEATSQVDAESENLIQKAIDSLLHERTTFVIAHRFSTIQSADEIVVMDRGRIAGQGRHEDLLRTCEVYQQLYERQLIATPVS